MSSNHFEERFPRVVYEADDYNKIIAPHASVLEYERSLISDALRKNNKSECPFSELDNIGRVIRVFEVENRIFLKNKKGDPRYLNSSSRALAEEAYRSVRGKIIDFYGGLPDRSGLIWLLTNLDSILIIISRGKIKKTVLIMKDYYANDIYEPKGKAQHLNADF